MCAQLTPPSAHANDYTSANSYEQVLANNNAYSNPLAHSYSHLNSNTEDFANSNSYSQDYTAYAKNRQVNFPNNPRKRHQKPIP